MVDREIKNYGGSRSGMKVAYIMVKHLSGCSRTLDVGLRTSWEMMAMLLSVVMPCLNEAKTLARCVGEAKVAIQRGFILYLP